MSSENHCSCARLFDDVPMKNQFRLNDISLIQAEVNRVSILQLNKLVLGSLSMEVDFYEAKKTSKERYGTTNDLS